MRNKVGALVTVIAILILTPGLILADQGDHPKKYGIELQLGGGVYSMGDINDYIPEPGFIDPRYVGSDEDDIFFGTQFGLGITYRQMDKFGWSFGYNKLTAGIPVVFEQKYRRNAYYQGTSESWVEQTISGSELYFMPTWFWPWKKNREIIFSVGPAVYSATLDRSVSIIRSEGSAANPAGSFADAKGMSLGLSIIGGVEFPLNKDFWLTVQVGGRFANVGKLIYEDDQDVEHTIYKNSASNSTLGVDFTGVFLKCSIRTYFKPSSEWRSPKR